MSMIAFLDVEASGLGGDSWPIEVAVALANDETLELGRAEGWLIRPADDWSLNAWDPIAGDMHGLSRETLERDGLSAWTVAERLTAALADVDVVYSDAPPSDANWLGVLYEHSPAVCAFGLREYGTLLRAELGVVQREHAGVILRAARAAAAQEHPQPHRALPDALRLRTTWLHVARAVRGGGDG